MKLKLIQVLGVTDKSCIIFFSPRCIEIRHLFLTSCKNVFRFSVVEIRYLVRAPNWLLTFLIMRDTFHPIFIYIGYIFLINVHVSADAANIL